MNMDFLSDIVGSLMANKSECNTLVLSPSVYVLMRPVIAKVRWKLAYKAARAAGEKGIGAKAILCKFNELYV